jgi:hypothetical protein
MKFIVNGIEKEVTLRVWSNKENAICNGGADVFEEIAADSIAADPDFAWSDEDECYTCSAETYDNLVTWWTEEVAKYNVREDSWFTDFMDEDEFLAEMAKDLEYFFQYN